MCPTHAAVAPLLRVSHRAVSSTALQHVPPRRASLDLRVEAPTREQALSRCATGSRSDCKRSLSAAVRRHANIALAVHRETDRRMAHFDRVAGGSEHIARLSGPPRVWRAAARQPLTNEERSLAVMHRKLAVHAGRRDARLREPSDGGVARPCVRTGARPLAA